MARFYVKVIFDPAGTPQTVGAELMSATVKFNVNNPASFELRIHNPAGVYNSTYELDDVVDIYIDTSMTPTTKRMRAIAEEIEIQRDKQGRNVMVVRGQDYLSILQNREASMQIPGNIDVGDVIKKLIDEYASGEFTYTNVADAGFDYTNPSFSREWILDIIRRMAEMPYGKEFDYYLDSDKDIHFFQRNSVDSGVDFDDDTNFNIKSVVHSRSVKDKKTAIHIDAYESIEETALTQSGIATYRSLKDTYGYYADDFTPTHEVIVQIELYLAKVGSPGEDLTGQISVADASSDPLGDFVPFMVRVEDISTTAGWVPIYIGAKLQRDKKHLVRLNEAGTDSSNTFRWYCTDAGGDARKSDFGIAWVADNGIMSMKIYYGAQEDVFVDSGGTPKREARLSLPSILDRTIGQQIVAKALARYVATFWEAKLRVVAPSTWLTPGCLVTIHDAGSGLASKDYRVDGVTFEFGARGTEEIEVSVTSDLPYQSLEELIGELYRKAELGVTEPWVGGGGATESELVSAKIDTAEDTAKINRSLIGYIKP